MLSQARFPAAQTFVSHGPRQAVKNAAMNLAFDAQSVLVTGSTAGIGFAAALAFAKEGARVIVNGRTEERVRAAVAKIQNEVPGTARPSSLLRRFITVEEVANTIVYLCSRLASATNGAAVRVDGGVVRSIV